MPASKVVAFSPTINGIPKELADNLWNPKVYKLEYYAILSMLNPNYLVGTGCTHT